MKTPETLKDKLTGNLKEVDWEKMPLTADDVTEALGKTTKENK